MRMQNRAFLYIMTGVLAFVAISCILSELSWSNTAVEADPLRQLVALPSVAAGNLNPSARNPGLELYCTSLNDVPGGYCYYFTPGVPSMDFDALANVTAVQR